MRPSNSQQAFLRSIVSWGGWSKLVSDNGEHFCEPVSKTISSIGEQKSKAPPSIGKLSTEEWGPLSGILPLFLNAYLQQQLNHIIESPGGDLVSALRLVDDAHSGAFMLATIILAREHFLGVEIVYRCPYSKDLRDGVISLSLEQRPATLTVRIAEEHGEEHLPLTLHYHGQDFVWDKDASTPGNPVWTSVAVDRKAVVTFDGMDCGSLSLQQRTRDEFLQGQGFTTIRFSPAQMEHDLFSCASEAFKAVTGKVLPPPRQQ